MTITVLIPALAVAGCASAPRTPKQARLEIGLATADRSITISAQVAPRGRFSYRDKDPGGSGLEIEKLKACMPDRAPASPTVR